MVHYLETGSTDPYYNPAFEEHLLLHPTTGDYFLLRQNDISFPAYEPLDFSEDVTPEEATYALKDAWGLARSPIDNIISVVEQHVF